jgi:hypothetical protein
MLHWLQNALLSRRILLLQFFCLSFFLHIFLVLVLTLLGYFSNESITFTVHSRNFTQEPIYFMPLVRTLKNLPNVNKKNVQNRLTKTVEKQVVARSKINTSTKAPVKKVLRSNTVNISKKIDPKLKKIVEQVKHPNVLKNLKLEIPNLLNVEFKKIESPKKELIKSEPVQDNKKQVEEITRGIKSINVTDQIIEDAQRLILGRDDLVSLRIYQAIQSEVSRFWNPPIGLSKDLECEIKASVDNEGKIYKVYVEKSSGVLVYDMSARMAFVKVEMPKEVYGKDIILNFKQ